MRSIVIVALAACIAAPAAHASWELAKKYECNDCHKLEAVKGAVKKKKEGPAYKEVAAKLKGKPGAEKRLVDSILNGSKTGEWGTKAKMDGGAPDVPAKDAEIMAKWILSL